MSLVVLSSVLLGGPKWNCNPGPILIKSTTHATKQNLSRAPPFNTLLVSPFPSQRNCNPRPSNRSNKTLTTLLTCSALQHTAGIISHHNAHRLPLRPVCQTNACCNYNAVSKGRTFLLQTIHHLCENLGRTNTCPQRWPSISQTQQFQRQPFRRGHR